MPDLSVNLAPARPGALVLANPVMAAAGTFGWGTDLGGLIDPGRLGAVITNGVTIAPRTGAPAPRVAEVPGGLVHAIGWPNPGARAVIRDYAASWTRAGVPVIVNVVPGDPVEAHELGEALCGLRGVAGVEVDITRALEYSEQPDRVARVVRRLVEACALPVIVKLPPTGIDVLQTAARMEQIGVDAVSAINTIPAMAVDIRRRRAVLASVHGGLSGPAVKAVALYFVWQVSSRIQIPVIGVGGIASANDALEFLLAGAAAVQVGSASFRNPRTAIEIVDGIAAHLDESGVASVREIVGAARSG